jgi:hypothetical protein
MVFKIGSTEVINSEAAVIHESFPQIAGTTQSTQVKITASDGAADDLTTMQDLLLDQLTFLI